ncbi:MULTISPECIES: DUF3994 domain-containing protein [unclassified Bacillus (in: firmicutes)]|uniref:DUF3994 domain-containing protein n=1 Tax=unclassified Bacillus (in: firmicutes) TaxID=185979 RepID=UPI0008E9B2E1|nr:MULTISPECIES: DUF3994 domain-containing protein [unclassified Bacillus (in: firmicutes)]SFJ51024.1 protein of unknown function [Bacillus sp. 71mf]SFT04842.1 protein of unknown function [Bacillus sp. 103mf]
MKMKKALAVVIPLMLLGGCGVNKVSTEKQNKTAETQRSIKKEKVSKEDYPKKIADLCKEFNKIFADFTKLAAKENKSSKEKEEFYKKLDELQKVVDKFLAIEAPSEYKETQENVEKSMGHFEKAFKLCKEAYSKRDKSLADKAKDEMYEADKYWDKFFNNIAGEVKIGDGTISAKDLNDLDKAAGIDLTTVRKNLSKDGKELVGTWGFEKDGNLTVSLILKEDGTFECYVKGTYPNKTDYFKGTWDYNINGYKLALHIKEAYEGGQLLEDARKEIPYTIRYFDKDKVQLFDTESFQTIRYFKQK